MAYSKNLATFKTFQKFANQMLSIIEPSDYMKGAEMSASEIFVSLKRFSISSCPIGAY
jgi:hypothetical protein